MNTITNKYSAPSVRIGILQSTETVSFRCSENFHLVNEQNEKLLAGSAFTDYLISISSSKPASLAYQIRTGIYKDREIAQARAESLQDDGFSAKVRQVGLIIPFHDLTIDNYDYWVVLGDYDNKAAATEKMKGLQGTDDATIVEEILIKADGEMYMNDNNMGARVQAIPDTANARFSVENVPIGIEFHWQREETLEYKGLLEIGFNNSGKLEAINELSIEDYLASVNSSEMTPDCPLGLLEAQTIAARSTVFATMGKHHYNTEYHLCSDDHCQCYQGALREQEISRKAIENTYGELLMHGTEVCDARYSKICGGIIENYRNVWDEQDIPYLVEGIDSDEDIAFPADREETAKELIDSSPPVFCNTDIHKLPPKLANLYSTENLFRWEVRYKREELEKLINEKLHINIGELVDIIPLARGASGRLIYIEIIGTKEKVKVGKELNIRRVFSKSHLYSSCFYINKVLAENGKVDHIILKGGGWGHGVGLCQVGATVMALKGYNYKQILEHYFKNILIKKLYFQK